MRRMTIGGRFRKSAVGVGALAATLVPLTLGSPALAQDDPDEPGCTRADARVVEVQPIKLKDGRQLGRVALWYSPSSRCVWGAATNDTGESSADVGQLEVWVVRKAGGGFPERTVHGGTLPGQRVIGTAAVHDANTESFAHAWLDGGLGGEAVGKTHWF